MGGNCFWHSIQLLRGLDPNQYMELKRQTFVFALGHLELVNQAGIADDVMWTIICEGHYATDGEIFITAQYLRREIHVYKDEYPAGLYIRHFVRDVEPVGPPLRILHIGSVDSGHFQALVPDQPEQWSSAKKEQPDGSNGKRESIADDPRNWDFQDSQNDSA